MSRKEGVIKKRIDWQAFWEDHTWPSDGERREFEKARELDENSLQIPFGPIDGSGNWENVR